MRIKKMNWFVRLITFGWANSMCLPPFGIYIKEGHFFDRTINGERIHEVQANELLIIFWYFLYLLEIIIKLPLYGIVKVYNSLSFEREANDNREDFDYLKTRKRFAEFKRILK